MRLRRHTVVGTALLVLACRAEPDTPLGRAAWSGEKPALEALLSKGVAPGALDAAGMAPLHWAARAGQVETIRALLEAGAPVDQRDNRNGWTPLAHAIHKHRNEAARALLEAGAEPDARVGDATALIFAAAYGNTEIVKLLLARGADPGAEASGGVTALSNAAGGGALFDITDGPRFGQCHPETIEALLAKDPSLRIRSAFWKRAILWTARSERCAELAARLGAP